MKLLAIKIKVVLKMLNLTLVNVKPNTERSTTVTLALAV